MRAEEKELEGPELERDQGLEREENLDHDEELPVLAGEEVRDLELSHRGRLFDALQLILSRQELEISALHLPQREAHALEFLQTAVTARDSLGEFVYAEDRRALLEQALAVLQQNLTHGSASELAELQSKYDALTEQVGELRDQLFDLEDAQEDMIEERNRAREQAADADASDEADETDEADTAAAAAEPGFLDAARSSLTGPERPERPPPASTLSTGPAVEQRAAASTLSDGPAVDRTAAPSTLSDGPAVEHRASASTLSEGPDVDREPTVSTLSEAAATAPAARPRPTRRGRS